MLNLGDYGGRVVCVLGTLILLYDFIFTDPGPKTWIGDTYYYLHAPQLLLNVGLLLVLAGAVCGVTCSIMYNERNRK